MRSPLKPQWLHRWTWVVLGLLASFSHLGQAQQTSPNEVRDAGLQQADVLRKSNEAQYRWIKDHPKASLREIQRMKSYHQLFDGLAMQKLRSDELKTRAKTQQTALSERRSKSLLRKSVQGFKKRLQTDLGRKTTETAPFTPITPQDLQMWNNSKKALKHKTPPSTDAPSTQSRSQAVISSGTEKSSPILNGDNLLKEIEYQPIKPGSNPTPSKTTLTPVGNETTKETEF